MEKQVDGRALLAHMKVMQGLAQKYIEPTPNYRSIDGENSIDAAVNVTLQVAEQTQRTHLFANDMLHMLDGPEQRFAENQAAFDYVAEANLTLSNKFHGELVVKFDFNNTLDDCIESLKKLDKIKKALFYGRDPGWGGVGLATVADLPEKLVASNAAIEGGLTRQEAENFIHGIVGIATEAGELLEALSFALDGNAIDRVNIKEEVGDIKWYAAILAKVAQFTWGDDERVNIAKLRARFPNAFTEHDAQNRNLSVERQILEENSEIVVDT